MCALASAACIQRICLTFETTFWHRIRTRVVVITQWCRVVTDSERSRKTYRLQMHIKYVWLMIVISMSILHMPSIQRLLKRTTRNVMRFSWSQISESIAFRSRLATTRNLRRSILSRIVSDRIGSFRPAQVISLKNCSDYREKLGSNCMFLGTHLGILGTKNYHKITKILEVVKFLNDAIVTFDQQNIGYLTCYHNMWQRLSGWTGPSCHILHHHGYIWGLLTKEHKQKQQLRNLLSKTSKVRFRTLFWDC